MMTNFITTEIYFPCTYGLATMPLAFPAKRGEDQDPRLRTIVGHAGADWGSGAPIVGYNQAYDFSFAVTMNSEMGQNCSLPVQDFVGNYLVSGEAPCTLLDLTMNYLTNGSAPRLNCEFRTAAGRDNFKSLNRVPPKRKMQSVSDLLEHKDSSLNIPPNYVLPPLSNQCFPYCETCLTGPCKLC